MKIITLIFKELKTPDDQGRDWYGWASNQMAHMLIGAVIAGLVAVTWGEATRAFIAALGFAIAKETLDDLRSSNLMRDSLQDVLFQAIGALIAVGIFTRIADLTYSAVSMGIVSLIAGVWPRARRALRAL